LPGTLESIDRCYDIPLIALSILLRLISPLGKEKSDIIFKASPVCIGPLGKALNVDLNYLEVLYLAEAYIYFISFCKAASLGLM